jgi:hypothetical protein
VPQPCRRCSDSANASPANGMPTNRLSGQ